MKSYDYDACTFDGAVYCNGCLPDGVTTESEDVSPIFADSERDGYPVCESCGAIHDYVNLTDEGYEIECDRQNIEVFYMGANEFMNPDEGSWMDEIMTQFEHDSGEGYTLEDRQQDADSQAGWYYWCCFPGCLPEGDAIGPFKTALEAAQDAINQ